jgi:hypothetical protein
MFDKNLLRFINENILIIILSLLLSIAITYQFKKNEVIYYDLKMYIYVNDPIFNEGDVFNNSMAKKIFRGHLDTNGYKFINGPEKNIIIRNDTNYYNQEYIVNLFTS